MAIREYSYARQKLYEAVASLIGGRPLQERLAFAALALVQLRAPQPNEIPPGIADKFHAVVDALTKTPLSDTSTYTPRQITSEEAEELASEILSMFVEAQGGL